MNPMLLTWICVYLGVILYFVIKYKNNKSDANAANDSLTLGDYLSTDGIDILIAFALAFILLISGGGETDAASAVPGLQVDFKSYFTSFASGIGIASIGVNIVLGMFSAGNKSRKRTRKVIDVKTNIADGK